VASRGEDYRGNRLGIEQDPGGPIALPGTPETPLFRVLSDPRHSAFKFRWVIADRQDRRYLMRALTGDPFQFGKHVKVSIGAPTRALLQSRGVVDGTVFMRASVPAVGERLFSMPVVFQFPAPGP
jgi:hypothetical protein